MKRILFIMAIFYFVILIFTGGAKLIAPSLALFKLDVAAALIEIIFALCLLLFWERSGVWLMTAFLFSTWAGYSTVWTRYGYPCGCLGQFGSLPPGVSLGVDILLLTAAGYLGYQAAASRRVYLNSLWMISYFFFIGLLFANYFKNIV